VFLFDSDTVLSLFTKEIEKLTIRTWTRWMRRHSLRQCNSGKKIGKIITIAKKIQ